MSIESRSRQFGKVFGHWQIREFLGSGSGGKSAVFRLVHSDSGSVNSALKVISLIEKQGHIERLSDTRKEEYGRVKQICKEHAEQEVLLMSGLQGRTNIVDYLDHTFVEWADENGFGCDMLIRMELLKDLRSEIENDRNFSQEDVLKIGREICNALVLCHSKNILHRDIKPENIFSNEDGNYKLGDFGVSRILSVAPTSKASTGVCTPEYAAPEQLSGKYDTRVDIYSLGLVLYELSNGNRLPFATSSYITEKEVQERMLGKPLPPPRNVSKELAAVILKACAFKPEDRYQTAEELLDALNCPTAVVTAPAPVHNTTQYAAPDAVRRSDRNATVYATARDMKAVRQSSAPTSKAPVKQAKPIFRTVVIAAIIAAIVLGTILILDFEKPRTNMQDSTPTERVMAGDCSTVLRRSNISGRVLTLEVQDENLNEKYETLIVTCDVTVLENNTQNEYTVKLYYEYEDDNWVLSNLSGINVQKEGTQ